MSTAIVVAFIVALTLGIILHRRDRPSENENGDTGYEKSEKEKVEQKKKGEFLKSWKPWGWKWAALGGYAVLLATIYYSLPEFWKNWHATKTLFWLTHGVVIVLIITPIWTTGHWFAKCAVAVGILILSIGTIRAMYNNTPHEIGAESPPPREEAAARQGHAENKARPVTAPVGSWSRKVEVPMGHSFDTKIVGPSDTKIFMMANENPRQLYLEIRKDPPTQSLLYRVAGGELEPIIGNRIPERVENFRLSSGESYPVEVEVVLR